MSPAFTPPRPRLLLAVLACVAGGVGCGRKDSSAEALTRVLEAPGVIDQLVAGERRELLADGLRIVARRDPKAAASILGGAMTTRASAIASSLASDSKGDAHAVREYAILMAVAYAVIQDPGISKGQGLQFGDSLMAQLLDATKQTAKHGSGSRTETSFREEVEKSGKDWDQAKPLLPGLCLQALLDLYRTIRDPGSSRFASRDPSFIREYEEFLHDLETKYVSAASPLGLL